ncbi:hypothetical protein E3N88_09633 [Mikania micrantha]|uniref:DUF4219 domain-containing protein n=1 Tax=Mikania micrantha TaxID=192012 RepID=A0A5N6PKH6_9ASTR|nr:hypothetical protein E3N88_09633 [Mikania micrantha]
MFKQVFSDPCGIRVSQYGGQDDKKDGTSVAIREQGNISLQCPKLTETNYTQWAILMETILKAYSLWETIVSLDEIDEKKSNTTKAMIFQTLPGDILMQVAQYSSAKEVWNSIKVRFLGEIPTNRDTKPFASVEELEHGKLPQEVLSLPMFKEGEVVMDGDEEWDWERCKKHFAESR